MTIESYRAEFPVTEEAAFLNAAASTPIPLRTKAAMDAWTDDTCHRQGLAGRQWFKVIESARKKGARLLGCTPREVAFVDSTSVGLSTFASSLDWRVQDNVVVPSNEFPSNMYPWLNLTRHGVRVKTVAPDAAGRINVSDLIDACDSRTRVVAVSWVGFNTGFRIDLEKLGAACRKRGIHLVVDAIQGLGAFPFDAKRFNVSAAAAGSHKWLLGPNGIGLLYVDSSLIPSLHPAVVGWRSIEKRYEFMDYDFTLSNDAVRFEPGSQSIVGIAGLDAAMELILDAGVDAIGGHVKALTDYLVGRLEAKGITPLSPRSPSAWSGIVSFPAPGGDGPAFAKALAQKRIAVTGRADFLRVSPHIYNNRADVDRFLAELP